MAQIRKHARIARGIVAAGTAGTAILLGPASAAQAKSVNWDAVAQCESGGDWNISTGNGYYGGLQFSRSTWLAHGGGKYAGTANNASRSEQIRIAEKVLDGQGLDAWPVCGKKGGSTKQYKAESSSVHKSVKHKAAKRKSVEHKAAKRKSVEHKAAKHTSVSHKAFYVVRSGDTLAAIARKQAVKGGWQTLYQLNQSVIGSDPNLIRPGQVLSI